MKRATCRRIRGRDGRGVPACAVRGLGSGTAGRRLPAGHVHVHGHGSRPDRPGRRLLRGDRRDDHARHDPAGQRGRGDREDEHRQRPDLRRLLGSRHLEVDRRARHRRRRNRFRRRHHGFVDRARLRRTGRGVGRRHPAVDDRARHATARPGWRHAPRERDHRARPVRLEAADGADRTQLTEHARRPGEGRPRLRDRGIARLPVRVRRPLQPDRRTRPADHGQDGQPRNRESATTAWPTASSRTRSAAIWS